MLSSGMHQNCKKIGNEISGDAFNLFSLRAWLRLWMIPNTSLKKKKNTQEKYKLRRFLSGLLVVFCFWVGSFIWKVGATARV